MDMLVGEIISSIFAVWLNVSHSWRPLSEQFFQLNCEVPTTGYHAAILYITIQDML